MSRCIISSCTFDHDAVNPDYATRRPPGFRNGDQDQWPGPIGNVMRRHLEVIELLARFREEHAVPTSPGVIGSVALTDFAKIALACQRLWAENDAKRLATVDLDRRKATGNRRTSVAELLRRCA